MTLDGRRRPAHGELIDDLREVVEVFEDLLAQVGLKRSNRLGLRLNGDRAPTMSELRAALVDRNVVRLALLDSGGQASR